MELNFKGFGRIITLYAVPALSPKGLVACWTQKHSHYRGGFVARFFWLGFVYRYGFIPYKERKKTRSQLVSSLIQQANDGDYLTDADMEFFNH